MEEEVYEVPRLPIESYRQELYKALSCIYEDYKKQGFMNALSRYRGDQEREMAFFLKKKLLVFQIIDEPTLLRGLNRDGLAISQQTQEGSFIIALQKILFEMDESVLAIILRQKLDEVVFISEGSSPLEAHSLAIQAQNAPDRDKIEQALKRQLIIHKPSVKEALPRKEKLVPIKEIIPSPEKKVVSKPSPVVGQRHKGRSKRKYKHPGKEILKQLIEEYNAKLSDMAKDPRVNASQPTLSTWINQDPELRRLAHEQREFRRKKKG